MCVYVDMSMIEPLDAKFPLTRDDSLKFLAGLTPESTPLRPP